MAQYLLGSFAGSVAVTCTHPLDLIKVRMQLLQSAGQASATTAAQRPGLLSTGLQVYRTAGLPGLYKGLSAAYTRQVLYTGTRLGVYSYLKSLNVGKVPSAVTCGALGALVCCPADVVLVRMQSTSYKYRNIFDGAVDIARKEGPAKLWSGAGPSMLRASLVALGQLACYDRTRDFIVKDAKLLADGPLVWFLSSIVAGFAATLFSNPSDVIKSRVMNGGYAGPVDCVRQLLRHEGPAAFWKGFVPNWARQGPQTMITMVVYQAASSVAEKYYSR